jgi:hypothetical protein
VYKQRENSVYLSSYLDDCGSSTNGWKHIDYGSKYWRYADIEEIKKYDELGKPFNINIITKENIVVSENLDSLINLIKKCNDNNYCSN